MGDLTPKRKLGETFSKVMLGQINFIEEKKNWKRNFAVIDYINAIYYVLS
jgi:hypothetical protein